MVATGRVDATVTSDRIATGLLGAGLVGLAAAGLYLGRGFPFVVDEWNVLANFATGGWLEPYNGHLSIVPVAVYQGLARMFGLGSHLAFTLFGLAVFLSIAVGWFGLHRRALGPPMAAVGALAIVWAPAASNAVLYPMLMVFTVPALALVAAWWLVGRDEPRADWLAAVVLAVALATSAAGVVATVAVVVEVALRRPGFRRLARFLWAPASWLVWWVFFHDPTAPASLGERVGYGFDMSVAILSGFTLGFAAGAVLVGGALVGLVWAAHRWGTLDAHVVGVLVGLGGFVALSAFSRAGIESLNPADAPRYVWFGGFLIIELAASCVRGRRLPRWAPAVAALVLAVGAVGLVDNLRADRHLVMDLRDQYRPWLVGAEAAGPAADRNRVLPLNAIPVTVGEYLDLVDRSSSPVAGLGFDDLGPGGARRAADAVLVTESGVVARLITDGHDPCPEGSTRRVANRVEVPAGATVVLADAARTTEVTVRRLALPGEGTVIGELAPHRATAISTPRDGSELPWFVEVTGPPVQATVCDRFDDGRGDR